MCSRDIKKYLNYYLSFAFFSSLVVFKYQEDFKLVAQKMKVVGAKKLQKSFIKEVNDCNVDDLHFFEV